MKQAQRHDWDCSGQTRTHGQPRMVYGQASITSLIISKQT